VSSAAATLERAMTARELHFEIEQLLYTEARLVDERRFEEWLALFAEDLRYFMPNSSLQLARDARGYTWGDEGFAFFDDTLASMKVRVKRLRTGHAWAEEPPSRTRRLLSNIQTQRLSSDEIECRSNFIIYRSRRERDEDFFVGSRIDHLRPTNNEHGWLFFEREIRLEQTVLTHHNLSIFF
jgi:3-phenylpropionate/trans-cinnamate dioxygenase beta subunit